MIQQIVLRVPRLTLHLLQDSRLSRCISENNHAGFTIQEYCQPLQRLVHVVSATRFGCFASLPVVLATRGHHEALLVSVMGRMTEFATGNTLSSDPCT